MILFLKFINNWNSCPSDLLQRGGSRKVRPRPKADKIPKIEDCVPPEGQKYFLEYTIDCTHPVEDGIMDIW